MSRQLSGVKRTQRLERVAAANDPKRTFAERLFDHLVGADQKRLRKGDAERFSSLGI
jgi:hypothetical protein